MHRAARTPPLGDPPRQQGRYSKWPVYSETKLANLLFTYELDRRCREAELPVKALAAHPGFAGTHLAANGQYGRASGGLASILDAAIKVVAQSAHAGALPTLMAATADLPGGTYCGPSSLGETRRRPRSSQHPPVARRGRPARAVGAQREDHRHHLPLSATAKGPARAPPPAGCRGRGPRSRRRTGDASRASRSTCPRSAART